MALSFSILYIIKNHTGTMKNTTEKYNIVGFMLHLSKLLLKVAGALAMLALESQDHSITGTT